MERKTILVTGGAGYIGSACTRALCNEEYEVVVFDNLSNGDEQYVDSRAIFVKGDVLNREELEEVFKKYKPSMVIHSAALKAVGEGEESPETYFANNVAGTLNVLTVSAAYAVEHIVFSSTAAVYEPNERGEYTEDSALGAVGVYGNTKILAEKIITEFVRTGKIPSYTIFRYFNVAGDAGISFDEKNPQNIFPLVIKALCGEQKLQVFGDDYDTPDGTGVRDYIHIDDLVNAHLIVLNKRASGIYNLGTGQGHSVRELIATFEDVSGESVPHTIASRRAGDPARAVANAHKAKEELGWQPKKSIKDMVASALAVYSKK